MDVIFIYPMPNPGSGTLKQTFDELGSELAEISRDHPKSFPKISPRKRGKSM